MGARLTNPPLSTKACAPHWSWSVRATSRHSSISSPPLNPSREEVLNDGFEFVAMARALVNEPGFVNRMKEDEHARCDCGHSNYCIARMYSEDMVCHKNVKGLPECIVREIKRLEYK